MSQADLTKLLIDFSASVGLEDPRIVLFAIGGLFIFLLLVAFSLRAAKQRSYSIHRVEALREKVEHLENNIDSFRVEVIQKIEEFKGLVEQLKKTKGSTTLDSTTLASFSVPSIPAPPPATNADNQPVLLRDGLQKTRDGFFTKIKRFFQDRSTVDESALFELEELLLSSDVGVGCTTRLINKIRGNLTRGEGMSQEELLQSLREEIESIMNLDPEENHDVLTGGAVGAPRVIMVVGVNGVGKTTSAAKLALKAKNAGKNPLLIAGDTFRAAAVEQLKMWGQRLNVPVVSGAPEAKPATVVFDGIEQALKTGRDLIIIDTAGRLHNKNNLMQELQGLKNIMTKRIADAPHETLLVVDGVSGNNALVQAREFNAIVPLTGLIVTKLDGSPKGGIVVAIRDELKLPLRYIGVGEQAADLSVFDSKLFVTSLLT